jgi:hypothetical protein
MPEEASMVREAAISVMPEQSSLSEKRCQRVTCLLKQTRVSAHNCSLDSFHYLARTIININPSMCIQTSDKRRSILEEAEMLEEAVMLEESRPEEARLFHNSVVVGLYAHH